MRLAQVFVVEIKSPDESMRRLHVFDKESDAEHFLHSAKQRGYEAIGWEM